MDTIKAIEDRRSIRKYKDVKVSKEQILDILNAGRLAPSAKNRQPWYFVKVSTEMKNEIADLMIKYAQNKNKILASIKNSKIFKSIVNEYGSFYKYLCIFTKDKIYYENNLVTSPLSDAISKDLQKRGMKFVGSTIIYSFLQAVGIIYSHEKECFLYKSNV